LPAERIGPEDISTVVPAASGLTEDRPAPALSATGAIPAELSAALE
jgi:hypothetical protein